MTTEVENQEINELSKLPKNLRRKFRKKRAKERKAEEREKLALKSEDDSEVEHLSKLSDIPEFQLKGGFTRFINNFESDDEDTESKNEVKLAKANVPLEVQSFNELPLKARAAAILQEDTEKDENDEPKIGKKKMKELQRMTTAQLKISVERPELVETWDFCSKDPLLLLELKAMRNTVPIPRHWCAKRKYLQGKRGFEKPAFKLPDFIAKTGIMEMRQTIQDKDAEKGLKAKMREKIRPQIGHVDIDYNKLHDAFFKEQTKPPLTIHGDIYYEGKEFEVRLKEKKPGQLSDDLRTSLGLPVGPNSDKFPPPWLIAMQRYGPPPSYPNLKIAGLNAPIPYGCSFGYHANGWGKPPVDETGRPIYGDVFMDNLPIPPPPSEDDDGVLMDGGADDTGGKLWGEIDSDEEDDDEGGDGDDDGRGSDDERGPGDGVLSEMTTAGGMFTPASAGLITPGGLSSMGTGGVLGFAGLGNSSSVLMSTSTGSGLPAGLRTPHSIELRKKAQQPPPQAAATFNDDEDDNEPLVVVMNQQHQPPPPPPPQSSSAASTPTNTTSRQLYQVLPQMKTQVGTAMVGSTKLYQIPEPHNPNKRKFTSTTTPNSAPGVKAEATLSGNKSSGSAKDAGNATDADGSSKPKKHKEFKF